MTFTVACSNDCHDFVCQKCLLEQVKRDTEQPDGSSVCVCGYTAHSYGFLQLYDGGSVGGALCMLSKMRGFVQSEWGTAIHLSLHTVHAALTHTVSLCAINVCNSLQCISEMICAPYSWRDFLFYTYESRVYARFEKLHPIWADISGLAY